MAAASPRKFKDSLLKKGLDEKIIGDHNGEMNIFKVVALDQVNEESSQHESIQPSRDSKAEKIDHMFNVIDFDEAQEN